MNQKKCWIAYLHNAVENLVDKRIEGRLYPSSFASWPM